MPVQAIAKQGVSLYKWAANSKVMKAIAKNYERDNLKFITGVAITSIVLKDALGCYMYVKQSLNNKKIPEEKRAFVAALDLANGGLMIASQLLAFFTISNPKVQQKMFNALFGKSMNRSFRKGIIDQLEKNPKFQSLGKKMLNDNFKEFTKTASGALNMVTSLVASTIFAKRMVVPFIATPLATYLKENHMGGKKEESQATSPEMVCQKHLQNNLNKYSVDNFTKSKQTS